MILLERIQRKAYQLGFDLCGFTQNLIPIRADYFSRWLSDEKFAGMTWLSKNTDKRLRPQTLMPETKSAIVVALSYAHEGQSNADYALARYAYGEDYHTWVHSKLESLAQFIQSEIAPDLVYRVFVDTGPILERDLAAQAGLGWIGKNTCLLNADVGSYTFLGVMLTNLDLPSVALAVDQCLDCRLCLDACPTQALTPYQLEPKKCLAYQNIEKRGERDHEFWRALGNQLVGCDICQEVCPWNHSAETRAKEWVQSFAKFSLGDLKSFLQMDEGSYKTKIKETAIMRIKYQDFMRNVFLVIANQKRSDLLPDVIEWRKSNPTMNLPELEDCVAQLS